MNSEKNLRAAAQSFPRRCTGETHLWAPGFCGFGGGIAAFSRELARVLPGPVRLYGKHDRAATWEGRPLCGAGRVPGKLRSAAFAARLVGGALRRRPGRIVTTHLNFGPVARLLGIPYAVVVHGVELSARTSASRLRALRSADQVIGVSDWSRRRLVEHAGVEESRIAVLPNTVDEDRFRVVESEAGHALRERYGIAASEKIVMIVARLSSKEAYKGYDRIVEALPRIRDRFGAVRFLVVGTGDDRQRVESLAERVGVADCVTFAGFVRDDELADHYRLADIFAMPSTGEGFGIVFLEAMACGTPVLGGNRDGSVDALAQGRLGILVDPTSVDEIGDGLIALLDQKGPDLWFDPVALSAEVIRMFGRESFRRRVHALFGDE